MKKSQLSGWPIFILAIGFVIDAECYGVPAAKTSTRNSSNVGRDDANNAEDIFVPYRGERFNVFDWNLCKTMAKKYQGNLLVSPLSVKLALVLLYEGSQDQTALELARVMLLPVARWKTREKFRLILRSLQPVFNEYKMDIGTRMYVGSDVDTRQSYASIVKTYYGTDLVPTNFTNAHPAAASINHWVSNITHGNIEKIIEDEESIKESVMLIINALYFKGSWHRNRFSPNDTTVGTFFKNPDLPVAASFMSTAGNFYFVESIELDAKILRIPYVGNKFAMYFILPRTVDGLDRLVDNIDPFILTRHVSLMQNLPVDVKIPKFKFEFTSHLESTLRELGIHEIFDNTATLIGIARAKRTSRKLVVTDILQKAGIEVTEEGTTAYATTEIQIGNKMADQEFVADHPFLFYIEDEITGTVLYMGRISDPLEGTGNTITAIAPKLPTRVNDDSITTIPASPAGSVNAERNNFFNSDLVKAVNEESDGNVIIAPLSVKAALMALLEGTGGRTRQQLISTLRLPFDEPSIRNVAEHTLMPFRNVASESEMSLATRLWIKNGTRVSTNYNNALKKYYNGDMRSVDFGNATNAASIINYWVRQETRGHIESILQPGAIIPGTQLLLTSALYFNGKWLNAFDENATFNRCFRVPNEGCQNVPMMENRFDYYYAEIPSLDAEVIEIPYSDGIFSMLVFLPRNEDVQSLRTLAKDVYYTSIGGILGSLRKTEVLLILPKFNIESKLDLQPILESMGIKDLFDLSANLTGILPTETSRVGSILHDAKIEVNEVGTVAAAVSALTIVPLMGASYPIFRADRPFIFTIIHRPSLSIMFAGRVVQPVAPTANPTRNS